MRVHCSKVPRSRNWKMLSITTCRLWLIATSAFLSNGVVNYPSDNGEHDHEGERAVSNAILVL